MSRLLTLTINDFRVVFRDPLLRIFLFLPLLIVAVVVWLVPIIFAAFPAIRDYDCVILMGACMQGSTMFGFINGFVFLEEKDENVFAALRVMPVTATVLLSVRMALGVTVAGLVNIAIISLTDWVIMAPFQTVLLAFQYALLAPLLTLLLATFAQNKVEGLAHFKVYSFLANLPILIYFLDHSALHALAVIPTYWSFRSVEAAQEESSFFLFCAIGTLYYLVGLGMLIRFFERRVF